MARRCGCSGGDSTTGVCSCLVEGQGAIQVTGTGQRTAPFVVSGGKVAVTDTATMDLTLTGDGREASPWTIKADSKMTLNSLLDVNTTAGVAGEHLAMLNDGTFAMAPAVTATPGAIKTDDTLTGDGSALSPLSSEPLRASLIGSISEATMPTARVVYFGLNEFRVRTANNGDIVVPGYQVTLTNPHSTLSLLVRCEEACWVSIASNRVNQVVYGSPVVSGSGAREVSGSAFRLGTQWPSQTAGPYESKTGFRNAVVAPGGTLVANPGLWCGDTSTPNQNISLPLVRYLYFSVTPQTWIQPGSPLLIP